MSKTKRLRTDELPAQVTKAGLAKVFDISLPTVEAWLRKGMPYRQRGGNGKPWLFRVADVVRWREQQAAASYQRWKGDQVKPPSVEKPSILDERP